MEEWCWRVVEVEVEVDAARGLEPGGAGVVAIAGGVRSWGWGMGGWWRRGEELVVVLTNGRRECGERKTPPQPESFHFLCSVFVNIISKIMYLLQAFFFTRSSCFTMIRLFRT